MGGKIYIGTSGWSYKHWNGTFYPEILKQSEHFEYYLKFFDTVELNNSFYHLPPKKTFAGWKKAAPQKFVFSVKGSRYITHMKKLKDPAETTPRFFENIKGLDGRLGPVLFQLPPKWKVNAERFQEFLQVLPKRRKYTFEFRDHSWYDDEIYRLLEKHNCAFCIYELAGHTSPLKVTADFIYIRLHGPGDKYQGNYTNKELKEWAVRIQEWASNNKDVYLYFDNDQNGYAAFNAKKLKELTEK